ncbi:MAG: 30S ribosomal protein S15, partial [Planctomycetota bacterium]|nr:30S ribosomal protein S15 [Planctomycetota bacterium]
HKHDYATRRGLQMLVGRRNRLLRYLARTNADKYQEVLKRHGLRK